MRDAAVVVLAWPWREEACQFVSTPRAMFRPQAVNRPSLSRQVLRSTLLGRDAVHSRHQRGMRADVHGSMDDLGGGRMAGQAVSALPVVCRPYGPWRKATGAIGADVLKKLN